MSSIDTIAPVKGPDGKVRWERIPAGSSTPRGARYRARWREPDGGSRMKTFDRKVDAEQHVAKQTVDKGSGAYVDTAGGRVRFGDYANAWAERQPHRGSTAQSVRSILETHILSVFGSRPLGAIRPSEVQAWVTGLDLAPSSVATVYGKLAAIFRAAVDDRLIAHSPCGRRIRLPRAHGSEVTPMTPADVRAVVDAAPTRYRALLVLLAGTGLRPGEALGITVDRVDWLRRTIRVDRQLVSLTGQTPKLGPPKTPSSVRTVPVPDAALEALAAHVGTFPPIEAGDPVGLIFSDDRRSPIGRSALAHMWRATARRAGVVDRSPHDLRHYAASVLIASGASVKAVQRLLGHASAKTTLDTYSHLWPDAEDAARSALAAGLNGVVNDEPATVGVAVDG